MRLLIIFFLISIFSFSQVNFSEDISPIIYNNCTECHRDGQSGPMSFTNYLEVASLGSMIEYVTQSGYMPPWHADPLFGQFSNDRSLNNKEIQTLVHWIEAGAPRGEGADPCCNRWRGPCCDTVCTAGRSNGVWHSRAS